MAKEIASKKAAAPILPRKTRRAKVEEVYVWPNLVQIELVGALAYIVALTIMAMFVNAPLRSLANPELTPNPAKAPWYFLGLQELLLHMHPALAGVIVPTFVLVGLALIPYYDTQRKGTGIWFSTPKGIPIAIYSAIYTSVWNVGLILVDEYLPAGGEGLHGITPLLVNVFGLPEYVGSIAVPMFFMLFIPWSLAMLVRRRYQADTREVMIALFTFFLASFVVLTIIGTAFRGQSMLLNWPWNIEHPTGI